MKTQYLTVADGEVEYFGDSENTAKSQARRRFIEDHVWSVIHLRSGHKKEQIQVQVFEISNKPKKLFLPFDKWLKDAKVEVTVALEQRQASQRLALIKGKLSQDPALLAKVEDIINENT